MSKGWYTKKLIGKSLAHRRMTDQLIELVNQAAREIAANVPPNTIVTVEGTKYEVLKMRSNLDTAYFLAVVDSPNEGRVFDGIPGTNYYLHRDLTCEIFTATREEYLDLANRMPAVIAAFEANADKIIDRLQKGFDNLKRLAGAAE